MPATSYRALDSLLLGNGEVAAGDIVPATFGNQWGEECDVDFDRLLELGVIEPASARPKAEPEPAAAAPDGADVAAAAPADAPPAAKRPARRKAARKPKS